MADLETLKTRLEEAEAARHRLMTTGAAIEIQYDGRVTRYARADAPALETYIRGLRDQIAAAEGGTTRRRRAIRVTF
ncbi:gpW family head-tail joining protein [Amaricoccus solimangrovi]|uniref:Phage tail protein n=1 Tax=Amaricoccus solimangrovi TaxID=2589815 RepID=A0A501WNC5_9RHOB|nr:gpW family head-tail joining protein [Amaricoccus solimangrovi]TPE47236.1 hypothetical protein FJM51_20495 [Amaricoccus solimangrovi]